MSTSTFTSLAWQLRQAAAACAQVRDGMSLPEALRGVTQTAPPGPRGAVQDIAYRTMRQRGCADALLARLATKPPAQPVHELLVVTLALAVDLDQPYAPHTLVNQAVEAAPHAAKSFVNAVLRRYFREQSTLRAALADDPQAVWNMPSWWIDALREQYPDQWQSLLTVANLPPPLTLRVNRRRTSIEALQTRWAAEGIESDRLSDVADALRLRAPRPVETIPGFSEGLVSVQDAGAQLAAPLVDAQPNQRVLDACAAPGGKTAHLLELVDCDVLALDHDAKRLQKVEDNLRRLGLRATLRAGDAADPSAWWDGRPFDRILADVPCTASGIVRRHPDIRWLRRPTDRAQLATQAARILDALWKLLAADGTMVFVTCSIFEQESAKQLQRFLARHPDAVQLAAPGQLLPTHTDASDHDGFFYARLARRAG